MRPRPTGTVVVAFSRPIPRPTNARVVAPPASTFLRSAATPRRASRDRPRFAGEASTRAARAHPRRSPAAHGEHQNGRCSLRPRSAAKRRHRAAHTLALEVPGGANWRRAALLRGRCSRCRVSMLGGLTITRGAPPILRPRRRAAVGGRRRRAMRATCQGATTQSTPRAMAATGRAGSISARGAGWGIWRAGWGLRVRLSVARCLRCSISAIRRRGSRWGGGCLIVGAVGLMGVSRRCRRGRGGMLSSRRPRASRRCGRSVTQA